MLARLTPARSAKGIGVGNKGQRLQSRALHQSADCRRQTSLTYRGNLQTHQAATNNRVCDDIYHLTQPNHGGFYDGTDASIGRNLQHTLDAKVETHARARGQNDTVELCGVQISEHHKHSIISEAFHLPRTGSCRSNLIATSHKNSIYWIEHRGSLACRNPIE